MLVEIQYAFLDQITNCSSYLPNPGSRKKTKKYSIVGVVVLITTLTHSSKQCILEGVSEMLNKKYSSWMG